MEWEWGTFSFKIFNILTKHIDAVVLSHGSRILNFQQINSMRGLGDRQMNQYLSNKFSCPPLFFSCKFVGQQSHQLTQESFEQFCLTYQVIFISFETFSTWKEKQSTISEYLSCGIRSVWFWIRIRISSCHSPRVFFDNLSLLSLWLRTGEIAFYVWFELGFCGVVTQHWCTRLTQAVHFYRLPQSGPTNRQSW